MVTKFKIGDTVMVLSRPDHRMFPVGTIGKTTEHRGINCIGVTDGKLTWWYTSDEISLVRRTRFRRPHSKIANTAMRKVDEIKKLHISNSRKVQLIGFVVNQTNLFE